MEKLNYAMKKKKKTWKGVRGMDPKFVLADHDLFDLGPQCLHYYKIGLFSFKSNRHELIFPSDFYLTPTKATLSVPHRSGYSSRS